LKEKQGGSGECVKEDTMKLRKSGSIGGESSLSREKIRAEQRFLGMTDSPTNREIGRKKGNVGKDFRMRGVEGDIVIL